MTHPKTVFVVYFYPDGVPHTSDGFWAGIISAHETLKDAEEAEQAARESGDWGVFTGDPDRPSYYTSDRGLSIETEEVPFFPAKKSP